MELFAKPAVARKKKVSSSSPTGAPVGAAAAKRGEDGEEAQSGVMSFSDLGLVPWVVRSCRAMGLTVPTAVQRRCVPMLLAGRDVLGEAPTGSGKTAAFALPVLDALSRDPYGVFALVLTPTRELAAQIGEQFQALGAPAGVRVLLMIGGFNEVTQQAELEEERPHVVVATPGRVAATLRALAARAREPGDGEGPEADALALLRGVGGVFGGLRFLVFDEADRLLDPAASFAPQVREIRATLQQVVPGLAEVSHGSETHSGGGATIQPQFKRCQTALFTATAAPILTQPRLLRRLGLPLDTVVYAESCCGDKPVALRDLLPSSGGSGKSEKKDEQGKDAGKEGETTTTTTTTGTTKDATTTEGTTAATTTTEITTKTASELAEAVKAEAAVLQARTMRRVVESAEQGIAFVPAAAKACRLVYELRELEQKKLHNKGLGIGTQAIVFAASCHRAELLHQMLATLKLRSVPLHGALPQCERSENLANFRTGVARVLVATDVAARGLDIPTVALVVNYDVPRDADSYVHRVGRTARAGRPGTALSLIAPEDVPRLHRIEQQLGAKLRPVPEVPEDALLRYLSQTNTAMEIAEMYLDQTHFDETNNERQRLFRKGAAEARAATRHPRPLCGKDTPPSSARPSKKSRRS